MKCKICNKKTKIFKTIAKINLFKCYNCDHIVSKINTNQKYYKEIYSDQYLEKKHKNWMNNPNFALFNKIYEFIKSKKKGKIVDLGSGTGLLCKFLIKKNHNYDITGIDIFKNKKFKNITFINKDFFSFYPKNKFKFIISIAVIEHIQSVKKYFEYIKRISTKDAYFIVLTINTNSLLYKSANILFYFGIKTPFIRLYDPHHLNHFSDKSLEKFIYKNKFKIIKRINTPISMKQIDYPYKNLFMKYFLYLSLYILLKIEKIFNKSWLQTVIFKKKLL
jgi:2-polyprenyl-3-methyl-5-hydroxy-6-metoxy-1,4-benzoquinol methylase